MKYRKRRKLLKLFLKWLPKKRHLHGGFLHKIVGDKLFDPRLWTFSIQGVAGGLALGTFVAFTPTFPFQMIMAGGLAWIFKVNVPLAIMACWITNPVTMPIVYPLEYKLGEWVSKLLSLPNISDFQTNTPEAQVVIDQMDLPKGKRFFDHSMPVVKNMFIGSFIVSLVLSVLMYFTTYFVLNKFKNRLHKFNRHINDEE